MLLVIFGAGASWDSVPDAAEDSSSDFFRPPLAGNLFDNRPNFGRVLQRFDEATGLVMDLRRKMKGSDGLALEQLLEVAQEEAEGGYSSRWRHLAAVRFYLQQMLWECSTKWQELNNTQTNYYDFLTRLDRWRFSAGERLALTTFNYDLLLDYAFAGVFSRPLNRIEDYVSDDTLLLLKIHGSVNWGRVVAGWPTVSLGTMPFLQEDESERIRKELISKAEGLTVTEHFSVMDELLTPFEEAHQAPLYPALAVPFATKNSFECPRLHQRELERALQEVDRIIVVGWRGNEAHFLKLLELLPGMAPLVQVVGKDSKGIGECFSNLESAGLDRAKMNAFIGGFSFYLQTGELERFLEAPVNTPRTP